MHKLKLVLSLSFQLLLISFSYGQTEITKDGFEKAINFANCKYVAFSLTNAEENQKFIKDSHSDKNPTAQSIKNAISKKKTKTIAFSKEFDKLKEINIDLVQKNIASFLTDSIFGTGNVKASIDDEIISCESLLVLSGFFSAARISAILSLWLAISSVASWNWGLVCQEGKVSIFDFEKTTRSSAILSASSICGEI